jgi:glyceraldehyde 3-phosphate dehydrogenase
MSQIRAPVAPIRVAINGFGRIGRAMVRIARDRPQVEIVAINNRGGDPEILAHLLRHDTLMGSFEGEVYAEDGHIVVDGHRIRVTHETDPILCPWHAHEVEVAVEATGKFTRRDAAARHLRAGARKVLITAPGRDVDLTVVCGVNDDLLDPDGHRVISGASCTTNGLAPVALALHRSFGINSGLLTTIHSYTRDQAVLDGTHRDPRRARAAPLNIVPTRTGAAQAMSLVIPELAGRLTGMAVRVPGPDVSRVDLSVVVEETVTEEEVNEVFRQASATDLAGILGVSEEPLVSMDFLGDARSAVVDAPATLVSRGHHLKVLAWYDNEWGYATRMVDLVELFARGRRPWREGEGLVEREVLAEPDDKKIIDGEVAVTTP